MASCDGTMRFTVADLARILRALRLSGDRIDGAGRGYFVGGCGGGCAVGDGDVPVYRYRGVDPLVEAAPSVMRAALERHDDILRGSIRANNGLVFATGGDGLAAAFSRAGDAVNAAHAAQGALRAERWPPEAVIRVRMGLHTGEAVERDGDYFGPAVNRAARLMAAAHGGQVVCSAVTADCWRAGRWSWTWAGTACGTFRAPNTSSRWASTGFPGCVRSMRCPGICRRWPSHLSAVTRLLAALTKALSADRLVTITGVGKVREARVASQLSPRASALPTAQPAPDPARSIRVGPGRR